MRSKCRRIAAMLISAVLMLSFLPTAVNAEEGERIYAKKLQRSISEISVVRYDAGGYEVLDTWKEGLLGRDTGEWLYCTEPDIKFKEGYKTGGRAENHMSRHTIDLIGALMCWYDSNMCTGVGSTDEYLFKQEIVWNILNREKQWRPGCMYEHGSGAFCGAGHSLQSHRDQLFGEGLEWASANKDRIRTAATVYEGEGQPLMDLSYEWKRGSAKIRKISADPAFTDGNGCYSLAGAEYRIYADQECSDQVGAFTTDEEGNSGAVELNVGQYYVKEYKSPAGYASDPTVYPITVAEGQTAVLEVRDIPQSAPVEILLQKLDAETGKNVPQGAATLAGGEFTVRYYPGLFTDVTSEQPARSWVFRTDAQGRAILNESGLVSGDSLYTDSGGKPVLPLGTVTIQETKAPAGYLINDEVFIVQITSDGNGEKVDTYNRPEVPEKVIRGELQIIKIAQDEDEEKEQKSPLEGVVFEITSKTTGESVRITTDENGFASTEQVGNLPYDTYVVSEVVTPDRYDPVGDFEITISEEGQVLRYVLEDKLVVAPVQLVKRDASTGKTIPVEGTEFQLLDSEKNPVSMTTYYPKEETHDTFITDETGSFILPDKLLAGVYYFREVKAPDGYLLNQRDIRFEISESYDWNEPLVIIAEDTPAMGRICVIKTDEYTGRSLEGAEFTITAEEDIVTPDGTVRVPKGTTVATLTTDKDGVAKSQLLYLGKYILREKRQPSGYVLPENAEWKVELKYQGQDTPVITETVKVRNRPTVVVIDKKVTGSEQRLSGVKFVIWNKDKDDPVDPGMTYKELYKTDRNGQIRLEALEPGRYCVREVAGVPGYAVDPEIREFVIDGDGRIEGQEEYTLTVDNSKTEITDTTAISADTDSKQLYPWKRVFVKDTVDLVNIQPGEEYTLVGILADARTGEPLREGDDPDGRELRKELKFTGTEPEMTLDMIFEFDASAFAGCTGVVYEYLYQGDVMISEHADPEDKGQQFHITAPGISTTAVSPETGKHEATPRENTVIRDAVEYKNIIPGTYILKGILMDRETGKPLQINGEEIKAEKTFEITEAGGTTELDFTVDASGLDGRAVVVFEYLYREGYEEPVAVHADIMDEGQTVMFREKTIPETGDTSDVLQALILAAAGAAAAAILLFISKKMHQERKRNGCRHRKKKVIK